ncbi:MAG: M48 family metalloprotease [Actinomycetota bacterium]|nr:M48 family metalloprotease [Actinomycetota bacterium]
MALDPQARIALLAHELGHDVNGDVRHRRLVASAMGILDAWYVGLRGRAYEADGETSVSMLASLGAVTGRLILAPVAWLVGGLEVLMGLLTLRSGRRAEHYADILGARLAGPRAAHRLLELLLAAPALDRAMDTAVVRSEARPLWQVAAERFAALPEHERERLRRLAGRERHRTDDSHPPTVSRLAVVGAVPEAAPQVVADASVMAAADAELARVWERLERAERDRRRA